MRELRTALAAVGAFAVGYLLPGTLQLPVLIYDPVARGAHFGRVTNAVQMRYYGDLIVASIASLAAAAIAWKLPPRRTPLTIAAATVLSLVALDVLFYLSRLLAAM
ncbi:MAG: hypothetical protein ABR567_17435 [Myxococcales bacterium]